MSERVGKVPMRTKAARVPMRAATTPGLATAIGACVICEYIFVQS